MRRPSVKNLVIGLLGSAVLGLGTVVALDHTVLAPAQPSQAASLVASNAAGPQPSHGAHAGGAWLGGLKELTDLVTRDTGLTPQQLYTGLRGGKSLDDLVGSAKADQLKTDLVNRLKTELDKAVTKGAISGPDETRLLNDAGDVLSVLMSAHLGSILPAH